MKYVIGAFCGDEIFDTDQSWAGRAQFVFGIQLEADELGNQQYGGEHDGSESDDLEPQTIHKIYNATYIGAGSSNEMNNGEENNGLRIRNDVGIEYSNCIFTEFANKGVRFQDMSETMYVSDDFQLLNNIWFGFGDGNEPENFVRAEADQSAVITKLLAEGNDVVDPMLGGISRTNDGGLDPRPNGGSPALSGAVTPTDDWFEATSYRGAFGPSENWASTWTALDQNGHFGELTTLSVKVSDEIPSLNLFPNPVESEFFVDFELAEETSLTLDVLDMIGRVILSLTSKKTFSDGIIKIHANVDLLSAGIYMLRLQSKESISLIKFIKK